MTDTTREVIRQCAQELIAGERVPADAGPELGRGLLWLLEEHEDLERRMAAHGQLLQALQARYDETWAVTIDRLLAADRRGN